MKTLRNAVVVLLLVILAAFTVVGAMATLPWEAGPLLRVRETGLSIIQVWLAGSLLFWLFIATAFGLLLAVLLGILAVRRQARVEVQMADGRVVIMESAIKKYVRTALAELPGISTRRIDLAQKRGGLQVDVYTNVRTQEKLPEAEARIMARVREALTNQMGIDAIAGVHVFIQDFQVAAAAPVPDEDDPLLAAYGVQGRRAPADDDGAPPAARVAPEPEVVAMSTAPLPEAPDSGILAPPEPPTGDIAQAAGEEKPRSFLARFRKEQAAAQPGDWDPPAPAGAADTISPDDLVPDAPDTGNEDDKKA